VAQEQPLLLSALPPGRRQKRLALAVAVLLLVAYAVAAPFASIHLAPTDAFIPVLDTLLFLTDTITAALLFAQFSVLGSRALLALASGFLFTGLLIIPHGLTFPGAFAPTGLLGAGLQTTVYLYIFWHFGLPCAAIAYSLLKEGDPDRPMRGGARLPILASIAGVVLLVCALTWLVTAGAAWLPAIMVDAIHSNAIWLYTAPVIILLDVTAIALVWCRRGSVLDLWLLVVLWAWLIETILLSTTTYRFTLVWYAGRIYGLLAASFVLLALLAQTTTLYARLAVSVLAQRRERENRLMAMDAALALVAHEVNQPLSAIVANGSAGLRELARAAPDTQELAAILKDIIGDGHRASGVIGGIRAMFKRDESEKVRLDIGDLVAEVLALVHGELQHHNVVVETDLPSKLPRVAGNRVQLQQVLLNLTMNAIEAMDAAATRARLLRICALPDDRDVLVTVEDSGPGLAPEASERLFDPFFTTKAKGMGLGLSICRSIIEAHGGRLWTLPAAPHGTVFHFTLPASPAGDGR